MSTCWQEEYVISVNLVAINVYQVVLEGSAESFHRVRLQPEFYQSLCAGTNTQEWVLIQAFKFLLEHEARAAIAAQFDLADLAERYPNFVTDMQNRLGFTQLKQERGW
ncbi:MAG: hypothetical protein ISQ65_01490 [Pseudomonadales bacterium]|nr:hypothetical protein [Pseudomonadales bacterium]